MPWRWVESEGVDGLVVDGLVVDGLVVDGLVPVWASAAQPIVSAPRRNIVFLRREEVF